MSWIDKEVEPEDLSEPYRTIAKEIGFEGAKKLARLFAGDHVYFPTLEKACDPKRKELIRKEFDGFNFKELAKKYDYTDRHIRNIVDDMVTKKRSGPIEGQISLFHSNDK